MEESVAAKEKSKESKDGGGGAGAGNMKKEHCDEYASGRNNDLRHLSRYHWRLPGR